MKRTKVIGIIVGILLISAILTISVSAATEYVCDYCLATQDPPAGHCAYYCTGDDSEACDCGGELIVWCAEKHQFTILRESVTGFNCLTQGTVTYACACGETKTYNDGPVGGHAWDTGVLDTASGKIKYTCTLCGGTKYEDKPIGGGQDPVDPDNPDNPSGGDQDPDDPIGGGTTGDTSCSHEFTAVIINPTCEEQGYTLLTCRKCGYSYMDNYVAALGHDPTTTHIYPTCTETGLQTTYCQRDECQKVLGQLVVVARGHNFVNNVCTRCGFTNNCAHTFIEKVYAPTCNDFGYTLYTCTICAYAYMDNYTTQLSHVWRLGDIIQPTCEQAGRKESTCTLCGEFETEVLPATGHKWEAKSSVVGEDNTTNVTYKCYVCGKTKVETLPTAAAQAQNWLLTSIRGAAQGFIDMYETLANGIEVGGVTAGEVITGTVILACFIFIWFVLANTRKK